MELEGYPPIIKPSPNSVLYCPLVNTTVSICQLPVLGSFKKKWAIELVPSPIPSKLTANVVSTFGDIFRVLVHASFAYPATARQYDPSPNPLSLGPP